MPDQNSTPARMYGHKAGKRKNSKLNNADASADRPIRKNETHNFSADRKGLKKTRTSF